MSFIRFCKNFTFLLIFFYAISATGQLSDSNTWKTNYEKGLELVKIDSIKSALPYLSKAYDIAQDKFKSGNLKYKSTVIELAKLNRRLRKYKEATELYQEAINVSTSNEDKDKLAELFREQGLSYKGIGDFDKAFTSLKTAEDLTKEQSGEKSIEYAKILYELSSIYKYLRQFDSAIASLEISNTIVKSLADTAKQYPKNLTMLSQVYRDMGQYEKALPLQEKVLSLYSDDDKKTIGYAVAIYTMALLYHDINEPQKEIPLYIEVKEIVGKGNNGYASSNNNLAQAYEWLGDYEKALKFTEETLEDTNIDSRYYATRLQNLAYIYNKLGNFKKAEEIYESALKNMAKKYGKEHPKYGQLVNNVGKMYRSKGDLNQAQIRFKEALDIFLKNNDENHKRYGYQLNDYALVLLELNKDLEAIQLMKKNLVLSEKNGRAETLDYFSWQNSLAVAYNKKKNYTDALPLIQNATKKTKILVGDSHPTYGKMLTSLSQTYVGLNDMEKAISVLKPSNAIVVEQIDDVFKFRSEKEKKQFLKTVTKNFDGMQSISIDINSEPGDLNAMNLDNQLMLKGLLLNNSKDIFSQLSTLNDSMVYNKVISYKSSKRQLSRLLSQLIQDRKRNVDSLRDVINLKETELVKLYNANFPDSIDILKDWTTVQDHLTKNDIAIEFSNFRYYDSGKSTDSIMYVAYVYTKNSQYPEFVPLFKETQVLEILDKLSPNELYTSNKLYDLIWEPLHDHLKDVKRIYFSPSGLLNQISFAAVHKNGAPLISNYDLIQLSSTNLISDISKEPNFDSALFIGGIEYDYKDTLKKEHEASHFETASLDYLDGLRGTKTRGESWDYLPGTLNEIKSLEQKFTQSNTSFSTLTAMNASESNFKSISGNSPNVLHIATHGYFYENLNTESQYNMDLSVEDQYRLADDPLLRSGLILAGANYAWKNGNNPNEDEDGILTALEISNLDLRNTNVVVLSACETGLGDIDSSEGVYGLQRAFKMAGVDNLIMSLWQVPDDETAEFMNLFYTEWITNKKNIRLAFNTTQRIMQKKYADEPLKWAAFVLFR